MSSFDQSSFNNFVLENNVIGFFDKALLLKSGRESNWYVNWRTVAEDTFLLDQACDFVLEFTKTLELKVDTFYGVPEGATKLGILCQYKHAKASPEFQAGSHVLSMGRTKVKEHGDPKDKYFLGFPRKQVVILEDVTTTGGSLLKTIDDLQKANVNIACAIGLTNRLEVRDDGKSVKDAIMEKGVKYFNMSSAKDLLPLAYQKLKPGEQIAKAIEQEFANYGEEQIKLCS